MNVDNSFYLCIEAGGEGYADLGVDKTENF